MTDFRIIPPAVPLTDPRTGTITHVWYQYLTNLGAAIGVPPTSADDVILLESADVDSQVAATTDPVDLAADLPDPPPSLDDAQLLTDLPDPQAAAQPESAVSPSGSPFTSQAARDGWYVVSGGTVSNIELSRNGTAFYTTGEIVGVFPVARLDKVRVTYTVAPTMTFFPR